MLLLYTAFSFLVELYTEKKFHNVYLKRFQRIYLLEDLIFNTIFFTNVSQLLQISCFFYKFTHIFYKFLLHSILCPIPPITHPKQCIYFKIYVSWVKTTFSPSKNFITPSRISLVLIP